MANYSIKEKLDIINHSTSLGELPIEVMPYTQSDEYYFVSYSHADYKEVYSDILRLQQLGINIWYDRGLPAGRDWEKSAYEAIIKYSCVGVIFYLSENSLASGAVIKEINFVKNKGKDYLSINLPVNGKNMPASEMVENISKSTTLNDEQKNIINSTFNDKVLYINYDAAAEFKAEKIQLLKKDDCLKIKGKEIVSVRNIDLIEINIPESDPKTGEMVSDIGDCAFANCKQLERVNISSLSIGNRSFFGCDNLKQINLDKSYSIGDYAFDGCENLSEVGKLPASIGEYAFADCKNLKKVQIAREVYHIGKGAFTGSGVRDISFTFMGRGIDDYEKLVMQGQAIDFSFARKYNIENYCLYSVDDKQIIYGFCDENGVIKTCERAQEIEERAFAYQNDCVKVIITNNVTSIQKEAFSNCENLEVVIFESLADSEQEIIVGERAFYDCKNLKKVIFSSGVTKICEGAFEKCSALNEVVFEKGSRLNTIGKSAFESCSSLIKIDLPEGVKNIESLAFTGCNNLTEVSFGKELQKIGEFAFMGCEAMDNINLPESLEIIGQDAFAMCFGITNLNFGEKPQVKSIGYNAFHKTNINLFDFPGSVVKFNNNVITESGIEQLYIQKGDSVIEKIESSLVNGCIYLSNIIVERDVLEIHSLASDCPYVEKIILSSDSIKVINKDIINHLYCTVSCGYENGEDFDRISENFFDEEDYKLPVIYYSGSKSDWHKIKQVGEFSYEITENQDALIEEIVTVICIDGKV